jgi:hypothetical protein
MADDQPDVVTVTEHGHPLYGLTVPVAHLPRYRLAPPDRDETPDEPTPTA